MYLAMTVRTVHSDFKACTSGVIVIVIQEVSDMSTTAACRDVCMTLLAQLRALFVQQGGMV